MQKFPSPELTVALNTLQNANGSADARVKLVSPAEYFSNGFRRL